MAQTLDEHILRQEERLKAKAEDRQREATMIQQAAVSAEHLTGDPQWDKFLTFVQPLMDKAEAAFNNRKDLMPGCVDEKVLRQLQIEHAYAKGMCDGLKMAVEMPKTLTENVGIVKPHLV